MKTINKLLTPLVLLIFLGTQTSCNLFNVSLDRGSELKLQRIATLVESSTTVAVAAAVISNPKLIPHFKTASTALTAAADGGNLSPEEITQILDRYLSNAGTYEVLIKQALALSVSTYSRFYEVNLGEKIKPQLKSVLLSLRDGINMGVAASDDPNLAGDVKTNPLNSVTDKQLKL